MPPTSPDAPMCQGAAAQSPTLLGAAVPRGAGQEPHRVDVKEQRLFGLQYLYDNYCRLNYLPYTLHKVHGR